MRNLHPMVVYFMFFYKINENTLELESFSHPFMILKDTNCSFLNFPMGITTNRIKYNGKSAEEKHIWLSYGEGDCQCNIAAFKESQLNNLINQNNKVLFAVPYQHFTNAIENYFSIFKSKLPLKMESHHEKNAQAKDFI